MMILALLKLLLHRKPSAALELVCVTAEVCSSNYQSLDVIGDHDTMCCITCSRTLLNLLSDCLAILNLYLIHFDITYMLSRNDLPFIEHYCWIRALFLYKNISSSVLEAENLKNATEVLHFWETLSWFEK